LPQAVNLVVRLPLGSRQVHGATKFWGEYESKAHIVINSASKGAISGTATITVRTFSLLLSTETMQLSGFSPQKMPPSTPMQGQLMKRKCSA
jgi:hypothetical protein